MADDVCYRIEQLYRSARMMPILCIVGIFIPILLIVLALLGILFSLQRKYLLEQIDSGAIANSEFENTASPLNHKLLFLRSHPTRFYVPSIIIGSGVILVTVLVVVAIIIGV